MAPKSHIRSGGFCRSRRVITPATSPSHSRNTWPVPASARKHHRKARVLIDHIARAELPRVVAQGTLGKVVPSDPASDRPGPPHSEHPEAARAQQLEACACRLVFIERDQRLGQVDGREAARERPTQARDALGSADRHWARCHHWIRLDRGQSAARSNRTLGVSRAA